MIVSGIAFGLSFDAFAVSLSSGCALRRPSLNQALIVGLWFGLFQGIMPILGWLSSHFFIDTLKEWEHWIAFGLLFLIGTKMIYDGYRTSKGCDPPGEGEILHPLRLCLLAIATSIDAFAVGFSFAFIDYNIFPSAVIICIITFILSTIGILAGEKLYMLLEDKVEYAGGLILIAIGVKILIDHM